MRKLILSLTATVTAFLLPACTTDQLIANGESIAGAQFVTFALNNNPGVTAALQSLADKLPDIVYGRVSQYDLGVLSAQLQPIFLKASEAKPANAHFYAQVGTLLASASKISGQNPTIYQGMANAAATDFANGMKDSLEFNRGRADQLAKDPPAIAVAAKVTEAKAARTGP